MPIPPPLEMCCLALQPPIEARPPACLGVFAGVAVGLASSTVPLYIAELAPAKLRGLLVSMNNSCIVIGQVGRIEC